MYKIKLLIASLLMSLCAAPGVLAKGSELKFESEIVAIGEADGGIGVLTILVKGFEVPVIVDDDTRIEAGGDEIGLPDLSVGDKVKVDAWFEDSAIVADEVRLLEHESEQFRLRGEISDVEFAGTPTATGTLESTRITLLGVDVFVDGETDIVSRGSGRGNRVPASDLLPGDEVDVRGIYDGGLLWADRIKVGERELGFIEVEGGYVEATDDGFVINLRESGQLRVIVGDETVVKGEAAEGAKVEVQGSLNESLAIVAVKVEFEGADGERDLRKIKQEAREELKKEREKERAREHEKERGKKHEEEHDEELEDEHDEELGEEHEEVAEEEQAEEEQSSGEEV